MDSVLHFTISLWVVFCITILYVSTMINKKTFQTLMLITVTLMAGKEIYDYFDYGLFSFKDMAFNLLGAVFGLFIASILQTSKF